ncbi:hypothetical protein NXS19_013218 [Fusarium pseudograminearum]|nr:hypothetical protein NXS19_013218 [Fusarium pseudograminearum]
MKTLGQLYCIYSLDQGVIGIFVRLSNLPKVSASRQQLAAAKKKKKSIRIHIDSLGLFVIDPSAPSHRILLPFFFFSSKPFLSYFPVVNPVLITCIHLRNLRTFSIMAARLKSQGQQRQERALSLDEALYNHLALPPHLPHRQDSNLTGIENALTDRLLASVKHLQSLPNNGHSAIWDSVRRGLETTKSIHIGGHVDRTALARELSGLGDSDFLAVYVSSQNCALYIRRSLDPVLGASVVFEAFETSARNEDVLATDNALQWDFPGCAVAVPLDTFRENGFVSHLANFLDNASRETLSEFSAHALKAGASMPEYRNASEPALISSMLMGILQQSGRRLAPTLLQKMVRDDVLWRNAEKPWRRLPYWLVLRVAISRYLAQRLGGEVGRIEYKFLLAHLFSEFLSHVQRTNIGIDRLDFLKKKICRRLVKLDLDNERAQDPSTTDRVEYLFSRLSPGIQNAVSKANQFIEASWKQQRFAMTKTIPVLPKQATFEDTRVDLKITGQYLYKIWQGFTRPVRFGLKQQNTISVAEAAKQHLSSFAREHFKLIEKERLTTNSVTTAVLFPAQRSKRQALSSRNIYHELTFTWTFLSSRAR